HELWTLLSELEDAERKPLASRDVRGGIRREFARVNRYWQATVLQKPSRRQSDRSASYYSYRGHGLGRKQCRSQLRSTPGKRNASSSVAVVVDDKFFSQLLRLDYKSRWPVRPKPDHGSDFTVR